MGNIQEAQKTHRHRHDSIWTKLRQKMRAPVISTTIVALGSGAGLAAIGHLTSGGVESSNISCLSDTGVNNLVYKDHFSFAPNGTGQVVICNLASKREGLGPQKNVIFDQLSTGVCEPIGSLTIFRYANSTSIREMIIGVRNNSCLGQVSPVYVNFLRPQLV